MIFFLIDFWTLTQVHHSIVKFWLWIVITQSILSQTLQKSVIKLAYKRGWM